MGFHGGERGLLIGSFDGKVFKPDGDAVRADHGANYYAVQSFCDIPSRTDGGSRFHG